MTQKILHLPAYLKALAILSLLIVVLFILVVGKSILIPLALGAFFAILFTPLSLFLEKYRVPRTISSFISLTLMIGIAVGLLSFIVDNLIRFSSDFEDVSLRITSLSHKIDDLFGVHFGIEQKLASQLDPRYLLNFLNENSSGITTVAINTIGSLSSLVLIPVFMFFFLLYRDHLVDVLISFFAESSPKTIREKVIRMRKVVLNYIAGVGKVMIILAVLNVTAYWLLGVKHAVFFGVLGALLNIIPYVGPFIGAMLPMSYAFLTMDSFVTPLLILGAYQAIQLLEGNILTPKIVGGKVNLNAFITFLGLLLGASIWGVAGMILIIPTLAILREIFELSSTTKPFALLLGESLKTSSNQPTSHENQTT